MSYPHSVVSDTGTVGQNGESVSDVYAISLIVDFLLGLGKDTDNMSALSKRKSLEGRRCYFVYGMSLGLGLWEKWIEGKFCV